MGDGNLWINCFPASTLDCPEADSEDGPARWSSPVLDTK